MPCITYLGLDYTGKKYKQTGLLIDLPGGILLKLLLLLDILFIFTIITLNRVKIKDTCSIRGCNFGDLSDNSFMKTDEKMLKSTVCLKFQINKENPDKLQRKIKYHNI